MDSAEPNADLVEQARIVPNGRRNQFDPGLEAYKLLVMEGSTRIRHTPSSTIPGN